MPGQRSATLTTGTPAPRCQCTTPLCFTEDEGVCCRCGRLHQPQPAASTRRLATKLAQIASAR